MPAVNMRQAFFVMPYNSYNGFSNQTSDDPIQNAFNNYATYYGKDNTGLQDTIFGNWFNPGIVQDKEFAQQVSLQHLQNEFNSPQNKMQMMIEAGINPNTAAAGIAGAGNAPSAGSPNSSVGAGASGIGSAAQAVDAAGNLLNAGTNAYEKFSLTQTEKDRKKAEISDLLASAFHNRWLGRAVAEMLPLQKDNERADTWLKLANFDKAREEKKLITEQIKVENERIEEVRNQARLLEKQGNYVDAQKLYVQAQTDQVKLQNDKLQWDKDFREKWHYDNTKPVDNALLEAMMYEDGDSDNVSNIIGNAVEMLSYSHQKGFNNAEIEDAYIKAFNEFKAKADVDADFAPYMANIAASKDMIVEFLKSFLKNPDDIQGIVSKMFNLFYQLGIMSDIKANPVNNATKPSGGVTISR